MIRKNLVRAVIPPIILLIFITVTATPVFASTTINPRLEGSDRYQMSTAIANQFSNQTVDHVVLASGNDFPDSLSASVLAHQLNAPIVLADTHTGTSGDAIKYIEAHLKAQGTVHIIGGVGVIGSDSTVNLRPKAIKSNVLAVSIAMIPTA